MIVNSLASAEEGVVFFLVPKADTRTVLLLLYLGPPVELMFWCRSQLAAPRKRASSGIPIPSSRRCHMPYTA